MHAPQGPWDDVPPELNQLWLFSIEDGTNEYLGPGHSPTWAPTGDRLVFDIGSVLWILDLPSGEKSQLTDFAYAFQPRWSPDNQRILFMRWAPSQGLWTISPDGSDLRELGLPSFSADWSPTGNAIVFNSADGFELLTMNLSDGTPELLVSNTPARCTYPRWAPDDSWIAYYRSYEDERGLWVVRPDGQDAHCLIPDGKRASWSPDGKRLVYEHLDREANTYDLWIFSMETEASEPLFPEWP
jgi:Tol biopolymer transport system component